MRLYPVTGVKEMKERAEREKLAAAQQKMKKHADMMEKRIQNMQEEMDAIGAPPFKERGKVTDEYIRIFKELWTKDNPEYHGEYASFENIHFKPKPVQKPHPPLWIGGESKAALRRTARLGDGWFPAANNPKFRIDSSESLSTRLNVLRTTRPTARSFTGG